MNKHEPIVTDETELDTEGHLLRRVIENDTVVSARARIEPDTDESDDDPTTPGMRRARR